MQPDLQPGARLGPYRLTALLGRGAMGSVWRAEDGAGRAVALKAIAPELALDDRFVERFAREGRAGQRIQHRNVASVLDAGTDGRVRFIVLELVSGGSLADRVKSRGPLAWDEAARLGAGIARGLGAIHAAGFIHRDLKPANVLLDGTGEAKISDLGLVGFAERTGPSLTRTSELVGTPAYMAPEQLDDVKKLDARADLHALGGTLYFALTGSPPFEGQGAQVLTHVLKTKPRSVRALAPSCPVELDALVHRLLEKDPAARGDGAGRLAAELDAIAKQGGARHRSRAVLAAFALVLVAGAVALGLARRGGPEGGAPPRPATTDPARSRVPPLPSVHFTGDLVDLTAMTALALELTRAHDRAGAREAWSRVIDSTWAPSKELLAFARRVLECLPATPPTDISKATPWRVRVLAFQSVSLPDDKTELADLPALERDAKAAFARLSERVFTSTGGLVRVEATFERVLAPVVSLHTTEDERSLYPHPDNLRESVGGLDDGFDQVVAFVPRTKRMLPAPAVDRPLPYGMYLGVIVPAEGVSAAELDFRLDDAWKNAVTDALVRSQGWPKDRVGRVPAHVTGAMWRTLSALRAPENAWTRGDVRTVRMLDARPWTGDKDGRGLDDLAAVSLDDAPIRVLPTSLAQLHRIFPESTILGSTAARAWVSVPKKTWARIEARWDDEVELLYDGKRLLRQTRQHALQDEPFVVPVELAGEWKPLEVRIANKQGPWGFELRIRGKEGRPLDEIAIAADKPR